MASAPAEVISMPPHEKTFASPIGGNIMVDLRQYAYVNATWPEVDDMGAVFGDPTWL